MKKIAMTTILLFLAAGLMPAKERVEAAEIIKQINEGKTVSYENAEIFGDLDLISLDEVTEKKPYGSKTTWTEIQKNQRRWRHSTRTFWSHVRSPISFVNCTFTGNVLAYEHNERYNETYNVVFHENVNFTGCAFQGKSAFKYCIFEENASFENTSYRDEALFKYSRFSGDVSFARSSFEDPANFKYTKFPGKADFSGTRFQDEANFKYTDFDGNVVFSGTSFQDEANFKYTKFPQGVNFKSAVFERFVNFKYAKFEDPFNFDKVEIKGDVDLKYTKYNGRSFSRYLLENRLP
ncbi:MAG: pentapeptide repeat-containing protein [Candidatus Aminicenantes bacterium]|nr:pentapeptide repeat-containing protein [Candidatus Aminicenantes bacterium]